MEKLVIQNLPDRDFWRGRKALLTGHTGFKGTRILFWLEAMGAQVTKGSSLAPKRPKGPVEAQTLALEPTRAETDIVNRGLWDLDKTVTQTAQWYRDFIAGCPERELYEADCCAYVDSVKRASMACIR